VNESTSYPLNGADRFQLYFDSVASKNTGKGNAIRAVIKLRGSIPEADFLSMLHANEAVRFISGIKLTKKWYSPIYKFESSVRPYSPERMCTFHKNGNPGNALSAALSREIPLLTGPLVHTDIIYSEEETYVVLSASHVLMDYAGMENLLASFGTGEVKLFPEKIKSGKSFFGKLTDSIRSTIFVASLGSWNMKRLEKYQSHGNACYEMLELSVDETRRVRIRGSEEIKTNALSFFLGSTTFSLHAHPEMLKRSNGNYFIAVPLDRRSQANKNVLMANYISFLFFNLKPGELKSVKESAKSISSQMISQARKKLPEKFSALMEIFRFIPAPLYNAFIELPGNGNSNTFAFSMLANSMLENNSFMGLPVLDVTHYAPVISPPGLNIVFTEFKSRLKIMCSFDESRIKREQVRALMNTIKKNLLD